MQPLSLDKDEDRGDSMTLPQQMEEYCAGNSSRAFGRFQFFRKQRLDNETIDNFVIALKTLASSCNFRQCVKDSLIRDK